MSGHRPTEYIVDFGDNRSIQYVRLNMALIKQNGAKRLEGIVRCKDCKHATFDQSDHEYRELLCGLFNIDVSLDGFCAWGKKL